MTPTSSTPGSMKSLSVTPEGTLTLLTEPTPDPEPGQALIRIICAPVNPADRMQIEGSYIVHKTPPFRPGIVAVGEVVQVNGGGLLGRVISGKSVVFAPGPELPGTWAEYALAPVDLCLPLPKGLTPEQSVNLLANAMTALGLVDAAVDAKSPALVMTAAAGDLGNMVRQAAADRGITVVDVVRGPKQAANVRARGGTIVVDSAAEGFAAALASAVSRSDARLAVDAVAGSMTQALLEALPDGATLINIGRLSGEPMEFDGLTYLVGKHQTVRGFDVGHYLQSKSLLGALSAARKAAALLKASGPTRIQAEVGLAELAERFDVLADNQSAGKTLVFPGR